MCNGIFAAGYPRITSGVMQNPKKLTEIHTALFPTVNDDDELGYTTKTVSNVIIYPFLSFLSEP